MTTETMRIRWNDQERDQLAAEMAQLLVVQPAMPLLEAVRTAQERVLPAERQRELRAWSVVQGLLEEKLVQAQAALACGQADAESLSASSAGRLDETEALPLASPPGPGPEPVLANEAPVVATSMSTAGAQSAQLSLVLESALIAALQSPSVEEGLVALFARAFDKAVSRAQLVPGSAAANDAQTTRGRTSARVLLAGFPQGMAKGLEDGLREQFDVRSWRPGQGPQVLDTLVHLCAVAVIPEDAEELADALRERKLPVVQHAGNSQRLAERLSEMLDAA